MSALHRLICNLMNDVPCPAIERAVELSATFTTDKHYLPERMAYANALAVRLVDPEDMAPSIPDLTPKSGSFPKDIYEKLLACGPNDAHVVFVHPTFLPQLATFTEKAFQRNTDRATLSVGLVGYINDVPVLMSRACKAECGWIIA